MIQKSMHVTSGVRRSLIMLNEILLWKFELLMAQKCSKCGDSSPWIVLLLKQLGSNTSLAYIARQNKRYRSSQDFARNRMRFSILDMKRPYNYCFDWVWKDQVRHFPFLECWKTNYPYFRFWLNWRGVVSFVQSEQKRKKAHLQKYILYINKGMEYIRNQNKKKMRLIFYNHPVYWLQLPGFLTVHISKNGVYTELCSASIYSVNLV